MARLDFESLLAPGGVVSQGAQLAETIFSTKLQRAQIEERRRKQADLEATQKQKEAAARQADADKRRLQENRIRTDALQFADEPVRDSITEMIPIRVFGQETGKFEEKTRHFQREPNQRERIGRRNKFLKANDLLPREGAEDFVKIEPRAGDTPIPTDQNIIDLLGSFRPERRPPAGPPQGPAPVPGPADVFQPRINPSVLQGPAAAVGPPPPEQPIRTQVQRQQARGQIRQSLNEFFPNEAVGVRPGEGAFNQKRIAQGMDVASAPMLQAAAERNDGSLNMVQKELDKLSDAVEKAAAIDPVKARALAAEGIDQLMQAVNTGEMSDGTGNTEEDLAALPTGLEAEIFDVIQKGGPRDLGRFAEQKILEMTADLQGTGDREMVAKLEGLRATILQFTKATPGLDRPQVAARFQSLLLEQLPEARKLVDARIANFGN